MTIILLKGCLEDLTFDLELHGLTTLSQTVRILKITFSRRLVSEIDLITLNCQFLFFRIVDQGWRRSVSQKIDHHLLGIH